MLLDSAIYGRLPVKEYWPALNNTQSQDVSPDGRLLVAASFNGSVCIRKMRDGSSTFLWTGEGASCQTVKFSPNGRCVAASIIDDFLRIWNVRSRQLVGKWDGREEPMRSVAFSPDGEELLSGWNDDILGCQFASSN
jgi:WD40 repeat protein